MPTIELSDQTFAWLQKYAVPLVDNSETVIIKLLKSYAEVSAEQDASLEDNAKVRSFLGSAPPSLTHTKLMSCSFNGVDLLKPTWNGLLQTAVYAAHANAKAPSDLKRLLIIPHLQGKKEDEGYNYLADIDLSYQNQDAKTAWKAAFHVAWELGFPIAAEFVWRHKDKAAYPGQAGRFVETKRPMRRPLSPTEAAQLRRPLSPAEAARQQANV